MHKARLVKLAKYLANIKPNKNRIFCMKSWFMKTDCGYAACAIGYSAHIFKKDGFRLKNKSPFFKAFSSWQAIEEFFKISRYDAWFLFDEHAYYFNDPTAKEVSGRIKEFVKNNGKILWRLK